ncbi:hypothetical protein KIN20_029857 [Parelaphostrongylus tenuis]|uniref:Uncharacterized protein n=1 Tax=Parelaphostrongylus tenuis TaxID=148309 RepID=A0AAD5R322_PARTN|nr:hypothetical protein KIN20_029857 [Parelaphostrongylus tenuis]
MILLLVSISTVFGCGVIPGGQTSTRTFTASGPSNLPIIAVYTKNRAISAIVPGIATSKDAVQALHNVLQCKQSSMFSKSKVGGALLPDFVISNILGQLQVNTTYEPLECQDLKPPEMRHGDGNLPNEWARDECAKVAMPINSKHLSLSGTLTTTNIIMANWSRSMWQNVVDRALRIVKIGSVWFAFVHGNGHCQLKLKVNCDIHETNIFI